MRLLNSMGLGQVLFFDVEVVPVVQAFEELDDRGKELFAKKYDQDIQKELVDSDGMVTADTVQNVWERKAALSPMFGKIVCISCCYWNGVEYRVTSFSGDDEVEILMGFYKILKNKRFTHYCGYYIKQYDIPMINQRALLNDLDLSPAMDTTGLKPWEMHHIVDLWEVWRMNGLSMGCSLDLLAWGYNLPSPKLSMDGSKVAEAYYKNEMESIVTYCEADVRALFDCYHRIKKTQFPAPPAE